MNKPFEPIANHTLNIAAASTSAEVTGLNATHNIIRVYNSTSATVFIRWGTEAQTAVTTDLALAPGAVESFTKNNCTRVAAISTGTGNVYITTGFGI